MKTEDKSRGVEVERDLPHGVDDAHVFPHEAAQVQQRVTFPSDRESVGHAAEVVEAYPSVGFAHNVE